MRLSRYTLAVVFLTFVLVLMGGVVHSTGSSLACPDWPLCYGSAMPEMVGKVAVEHSHRLVATTIGFLTIVLVVLLWRRRRDYPRLVRLAGLALLLVVVQGVLGGLTVIFKLPTEISTAHLTMSQLFLATLVVIALRARRLEGGPPATVISSGLRMLLAVTAIDTFLQLVLGALTRHTGGALACVDVPLCKGQLFPDGAHWVVMLHMTHRLNAVILGVVATATAIGFARAALPSSLKALAIALPILVAGQIALGILAILTFLHLHVVTGHLALAALLWNAQVVMLVLTTTRRLPVGSSARASDDSRTPAAASA
jgi:heme A synthase